MRVAKLESIAERLDLIEDTPEPIAEKAAPSAGVSTKSSRDVFIVHGRDEEAKSVVARCLTTLNLNPIILMDQPNQGATVIEKFEKNSDVGFAIVLITPDDVGGLTQDFEKNSTGLQPRARQNVVLELGYFVGRLGRPRVFALKKGEVELPSDIIGVVTTPMDAGGAWKLALGRELKAAKIDVDMNKLI
jgi:predicted nucleotide-binding protein